MSPDRLKEAKKAVFIAGAAVLLVLSFVPWANWLGVTSETEAAQIARIGREWILFLALVLPVATLVTARWGPRIDARFESWRLKVLGIQPASYAATAGVAVLAAAALLSIVLFERNPHLVDSIAQLFQARIFAGGNLTAPAPEHIEFFAASHLVSHAGRWFSQYPPGHPALLALGVLSGLPWLVNPLLAAATVVLLFGAGRRLLDETSARLAVALLVISPFALFMSASYMNHVSSAFFLTLALYAAVRGWDQRRSGWFAAAGLALGFAAMVRPLEAAAWAFALGIWILARCGLRRATITAGFCLLALIPLLAYNAATTGEPLRFGYSLLWGEGHGLGFHTDPWGEPFTPLISFANTSLDFQRLNSSLLGFPLPSLIFIAFAFFTAAWYARRREAIALLSLLLLAAPAAYFFYWHRDNYLGPRFLYSSLGPALLLTAAGMVELDRRLGRWRGVLRITVVAAALYGVGVRLPAHAGIISGVEPELKLHPERELERQGIDRGLVLVKVGWGSRLIGRFWGWGVSASETERTFRVVDGCRLQVALDEADSLVSAGLDSVQALEVLLQHLSLAGSRGLCPGPAFAESPPAGVLRRPFLVPLRSFRAAPRGAYPAHPARDDSLILALKSSRAPQPLSRSARSSR